MGPTPRRKRSDKKKTFGAIHKVCLTFWVRMWRDTQTMEEVSLSAGAPCRQPRSFAVTEFQFSIFCRLFFIIFRFGMVCGGDFVDAFMDVYFFYQFLGIQKDLFLRLPRIFIFPWPSPFKVNIAIVRFLFCGK